MAKQLKRAALGIGEAFAGFGISADLPTVIEVELSELVPNPHQPRQHFDEESLRELADSIEEHGLLNPITVMDASETGFIIVAGERRYRAYQILERRTIPAIRIDGNPAHVALIENVQRQDLHPMESAQAIDRLMREHGHTQETMARVLGKSRVYITELLSLVGLPEQIQSECRTSDTPKSTLIELARIKDEGNQLATWGRVQSGEFTVKDVRAAKKGGAKPREKSAEERMLISGIIFLKSLQNTSADALRADEAQRNNLVELRRKIGLALDVLISKIEHPSESSKP